MFPAQPDPNLYGQQPRPSQGGPHQEQAKAITVLRSGRAIGKENPPLIPNEVDESDEVDSLPKKYQLEDMVDDGAIEKGETDEPIKNDGEFIRRPVKEPMVVETPIQPLPAPFPQRLQKNKQDEQSQQFLELFKQVKINLPLLEVIK